MCKSDLETLLGKKDVSGKNYVHMVANKLHESIDSNSA